MPSPVHVHRTSLCFILKYDRTIRDQCRFKESVQREREKLTHHPSSQPTRKFDFYECFEMRSKQVADSFELVICA